MTTGPELWQRARAGKGIPEVKPGLHSLTPAEKRVARQVAEGLSNKEVSTALGKSEATIKHQLASAMRKLKVSSRGQLIVLLLRWE